MLIDRDLPRLIEARGMDPSLGAAALRVVSKMLYHRPRHHEEALHCLCEALGCLDFGQGRRGTGFDMALGQGVKLIANHLDAGGSTIVLPSVMPEAMQNAILDGPLSKVVDHAILGQRIVKNIGVVGPNTYLRLDDQDVDVAIAMPARKRDLDRAHVVWAEMRERHLVEAGATEGWSAKVVTTTIKRFIVVEVVAIVLAAILTASTDVAGGVVGLVIGTLVAIAMAALTGYVLSRREDHDLNPRLQDLRRRRLAARREALLSGTEK
jgi:hypothetical protein